MINFKGAFQVALKPTTVGKMAKTFNYRDGFMTVIGFMVLLLIINAIFAALGASAEAKEVNAVVYVNFLSSLLTLIVTTVAILITGALAAMTAKYAFHKAGNIEKTFGAVSYMVVPIFIIGIITNLFLLYSIATMHSLAASFYTIESLLALVSLAWGFYIGVYGVKATNQTNLAGAAIAMGVGLFVAFLIAMLLTKGLAMVLAPIAFA